MISENKDFSIRKSKTIQKFSKCLIREMSTVNVQMTWAWFRTIRTTGTLVSIQFYTSIKKTCGIHF